MVKKISALVLALVICLSVVVMPMSVNAAKVELNGQDMAFALEWDKPYYNPGDTAYLSVYMDADDALSLYTGSFVIGLSSSVFDPAADEHQTEALRANTTMADWFATYYKTPDTQMSQLAATVTANVNNANTAEEQALYNWYVKFTAGRSTTGTHDNIKSTNSGFGGDEFNPDEPILVIPLTVKADATPGVVAKAAITSGSKTCSPVQTTWKYYKNPGVATGTANLTADVTNVEKAITPDEVLVTEDIVNPLKGQIRFDTNPDGSDAGTFDIRALAVISGDDFTDKFGTEEEAAKMIKEIGFVFASGSNVTAPSVAAAEALAKSENTEADGYKKVTVKYLSSSISDGNYAFSCIVEDIPVAQKTNTLGAVGYIKYVDKNGAEVYSFYAAAQSVSFETLYNAYYNSAFPA